MPIEAQVSAVRHERTPEKLIAPLSQSNYPPACLRTQHPADFKVVTSWCWRNAELHVANDFQNWKSCLATDCPKSLATKHDKYLTPIQPPRPTTMPLKRLAYHNGDHEMFGDAAGEAPSASIRAYFMRGLLHDLAKVIESWWARPDTVWGNLLGHIAHWYEINIVRTRTRRSKEEVSFASSCHPSHHGLSNSEVQSVHVLWRGRDVHMITMMSTAWVWWIKREMSNKISLWIIVPSINQIWLIQNEYSFRIRMFVFYEHGTSKI